MTPRIYSETLTINISGKVLEISVEIGRDMIARELENLAQSAPELAAEIIALESLGVSIIKMSTTYLYIKE